MLYWEILVHVLTHESKVLKVLNAFKFTTNTTDQLIKPSIVLYFKRGENEKIALKLLESFKV